MKHSTCFIDHLFVKSFQELTTKLIQGCLYWHCSAHPWCMAPIDVMIDYHFGVTRNWPILNRRKPFSHHSYDARVSLGVIQNMHFQQGHGRYKSNRIRSCLWQS